jgi:hypothetical protein
MSGLISVTMHNADAKQTIYIIEQEDRRFLLGNAGVVI